MNQANWIGVVISTLLYGSLSWLIESAGWPRSMMFLFIAVLMLPIVLFYHPTADSLEGRPVETKN